MKPLLNLISLSAVLLTLAALTQTAAASTATLPDARGWELVSPLDKNGGSIEGFGQNHGGGVLQASADGNSITYSSASSFGEGQGAPAASQYLARRGSGGWSTENIDVPLFSGAYGNEPNGVPYQLFSSDLSSGLLLNGRHCRGQGKGCPVPNPPLPGTGAPPGYIDYYLRDDVSGSFEALLTDANTTELALAPEDFDISLAGATPDLSHILLSSCAAMTPDATEVPAGEGCDPGSPNLYEWSEGALRLINLPPGDSKGTPGATLGAQSGAVSADGSRIYWSDGAKLYLREGEETIQVDEAVGGGGTFQTASRDGSIAFFTKAEHLYRYDAKGKEATDLTSAGGAQGVLGASDDGSYLYYLTNAGLFLDRNGETTAVALGADPSDYPPATGTARVSPDGAHLAFLSSASLTGYDNAGNSEVFLYDASANGGKGTLSCASCNPTGAKPLGPSTIPGAIANGEGPDVTDANKPRALSEDGKRLFFDSSDALVVGDANADRDVYEWEAQGTGSCQKAGGCIALISSGRSEGGASFVDASTDGSDAFFLSDGSLVPQDPGSLDLYDAKVGGGFPVSPQPIACEGDACQPLPPTPEDPTPGTLFAGPGNPAVHFPKKHKKHHHHGKPHKKRGAKHKGRGSR